MNKFTLLKAASLSVVIMVGLIGLISFLVCHADLARYIAGALGLIGITAGISLVLYYEIEDRNQRKRS